MCLEQLENKSQNIYIYKCRKRLHIDHFTFLYQLQLPFRVKLWHDNPETTAAVAVIHLETKKITEFLSQDEQSFGWCLNWVLPE